MKNLVVKEKRSSRPLKQKLKLKLNLKRFKKTKNVVSKKKTRNLRRLKWKPTHIAADPPTKSDPISAPCPHEEFHPAPDLSSLRMWEERNQEENAGFNPSHCEWWFKTNRFENATRNAFEMQPWKNAEKTHRKPSIAFENFNCRRNRSLTTLQYEKEIKVATKKKFARRGKKHSLGSLEQCFIEFEEDLEELKASYALEYGDQDTNSKGKNCGCCMEVGFEYCDTYTKCKGEDFFAYCSDSEF